VAHPIRFGRRREGSQEGIHDPFRTDDVHGRPAAAVRLRRARRRRAETDPALGLRRAAPSAGNDSIRPFRVSVPEEALADLRRRVAAIRRLDRETVDDRLCVMMVEADARNT
jgi:hypothetical protein